LTLNTCIYDNTSIMKYENCFIVTLLITFSCYACQSQKSSDTGNYIDIKVRNNFSDTCIVLKDARGDTISFYRDIKVVENLFLDTVSIGFSILHPKRTQDIFISQIDSARGKILYRSPHASGNLDDTDSPESLIKFLCIYRYTNHNVDSKGQYMIIRLKTK
jgi:hypothetical protein